MDPVLRLIIIIVQSYLIGSIPNALIIGKRFFGIDVRTVGSGAGPQDGEKIASPATPMAIPRERIESADLPVIVPPTWRSAWPQRG